MVLKIDHYITGVTNHWTGLDWIPKICFYALWYAIPIK